jgi:predicted molibdopterin-dependent oxidoreductase YjgC
VIGQRLGRIVAEHGPDALAAISSARVTNEENYLLQKLMRSGDRHQQRRQLLPAVPRTVRGRSGGRVWLDGGTGSFDDLDRADCILLVGANPTEAHPVVGVRLKQLVRSGAGLVVIDPRRTELTETADVHLEIAMRVKL